MTPNNPLDNHKTRRFLFFQIGLIIAISLALLSFNIPFYYDEPEEIVTEMPIIDIITINEAVPTKHKSPPPPPIVQPKKKIFKFEPVASIEPIPLPEPITPDKPIELPDDFEIPDDHTADNEKPIPVAMLQEKPEFPGGKKALDRFIQKNFKVPEIDRVANNTGTIHTMFIIGKDGKIKDIQVKALSKSLEKEALRVLKMMPQWKPGKQFTKNVNVAFTYPITIRL